MIWTEMYRPKSLKDFIGNRNIVSAAKRWMEMHWKGRAPLPILILHGRSGIGKTTLSHCLAADFDCAITELNASDERNVGQIKRAIQFTGVAGLDKKKRLTILDEADNLTKSAQQLLVSKAKLLKQPMILLVNDMDKIILDLQKISLKLEMKKPTDMQKLSLAKEIIEEEGIEPWDLKKVVESSESFRDLLNNLFFDAYGEAFADDKEGNKLELIGAMLRGEVGSERLKIAPEELLRFVYQNKIHHILRDVDVWLTVAKQTGNYRLWAHAFAVMELQRHRGEVRRPKGEFKARAQKRKVEVKPRKVMGTSKKIKATKAIVKRSNSLLKHLG